MAVQMPYGVPMPFAAQRRACAPARGIVSALLAIALAWSMAACGSTAKAGQPTGPSQDVLACRAQWKALGDSLKGRDDQTNPSDLAERWNASIATVQYYTTTATAQDCQTALNDQNATIARIKTMSAELRPYDIAHRMGALAPAATDYLTNPLPKAHRSHGRLIRPPKKAVVQAALTTLQNQATVSMTDMADGWAEANSADLTRPAAVRRVLKDLGFLAGDSGPFQACLAALGVLQHAASFVNTP
jgi:hypothetical protein